MLVLRVAAYENARHGKVKKGSVWVMQKRGGRCSSLHAMQVACARVERWRSMGRDMSTAQQHILYAQVVLSPPPSAMPLVELRPCDCRTQLQDVNFLRTRGVE